MLGITVPDAIALGMLFLAAAAAWRGASRGEVAATTIKPASVVSGIGGAFVTAEMMDGILGALKDIARAVREGSERREKKQMEELEHKIERLMDLLDKKHS